MTPDAPAAPEVTPIPDEAVPLAALDNNAETLAEEVITDTELTDIQDEEVPLAAQGNDAETAAEEETPASELTDIQDEEVPLAVLDDEEGTIDGEIADIPEEEVPLAASVPAAAQRVWWSWIPVIGAIASAVEGYRRNKQEKEESADDKKEE